MSTDMSSGTTPDDGFAELAALCEQLSGFDGMLNVHHVDGWLTAMTAGPVRLATDDWLERMCEDAFDRAFADPDDRAQALAILERRLQVLRISLDAEALLDHPDDLRLDPFFDEWTDEDRQEAIDEGQSPEDAAALQPGCLWARGVLFGLESMTEPWQLPEDDDVFDEEFEALLEHVGALVLAPGSSGWDEFVQSVYGGQAPTRDELLTNACFAVQDLRLMLLDYGPRPAPRRVAPQPGRNDPCPCGSGKKFKKCHGATA